MTPLIKPTGLQVNIDLINRDCDQLIRQVGWGQQNQIGLNSRDQADNIWFDAAGSLYNRTTKEFIGREQDFCNINPLPTYLRDQLLKLQQSVDIKFGRIRIMRLLPKTGLTVHSDSEPRYHLVLKTNQWCYFCFNESQPDQHQDQDCRAYCYHIPLDSQWYFCDTTKTHWVYNGGQTERIHIVVCVVN